MVIQDQAELRKIVAEVVAETPVIDVHTHLHPPGFGDLLLWGIDDLLTYHYLVAETLRWVDLPYDRFWALDKRQQADLVWQTLFLNHSPYSEACRGVLTILQQLGLDVGGRDLEAYRRHFAGLSVGEYTDQVLRLARVKEVVMTNDPFDPEEREAWLRGGSRDRRFKGALRLDALLNAWPTACAALAGWGYSVSPRLGPGLDDETLAEVRRFLNEWSERLEAVYLAVSLPPSFAFPEESERGRLLAEGVLPVCRERNLPLALMIGVKKLTNPGMRLAGDSVGKADIEVVERLCAAYPHNKFLVTMLSRENQHELAVAARKFRNLMVFGCWWFLNNPSLVDEITRLRLELLGVSFIPQHSDARVLDQLIYKWVHARKVIAGVLSDKYADLLATGWRLERAEIERDAAALFGGNLQAFLALSV